MHGLIKEFSRKPCGQSGHSKEHIFVKGRSQGEYAPLKFLKKKMNALKSTDQLVEIGMISDSLGLVQDDQFINWFQRQFTRKLTLKMLREILLWRIPNVKEIFDSVDRVYQSYEVLRKEKIIMNGKNLPIQLGEWYAKCIFGLEQRKTASQRGFDFFLEGKRIEVKAHWAEQASLKGVKLKKSLVVLSDYTMIIYLDKDLKIRDICLLDSGFIIKKFSSKGHTIFLKDGEISNYFFGQSPKHLNKVIRRNFLVQCSSSSFAMKISEYF